jgi:hypothetical protein
MLLLGIGKRTEGDLFYFIEASASSGKGVFMQKLHLAAS